MTETLVILTCFNRKKKTIEAIRTLINQNKSINFTFIVVDSNSKDGTIDELKKLKKIYNINIIYANEKTFYSNGMRLGMEFAKNSLEKSFNYLLMINDDVVFEKNSIEKMIDKSLINNNSVIVGATKNDSGETSYGGIKYISKKSIKYKKVNISDKDLECDTFNANCVLIPYKVFLNVGSIDEKYIHSLGDFDYGLKIKKLGYKIYLYDNYIGTCNNNTTINTWQDKSLNLFERLKKKESVKGAPLRPWFYYLKKNFGISKAILYSITPYIRILLGR